MKLQLQRLSYMVTLLVIIISCNKNNEVNTYSPPPPSPPSVVTTPCDNRPVINARLVPIGNLSEGRIRLVSATAGNKILFAGGIKTGGIFLSSRVDIYDTTAKTWSTAELTIPERYGMAVATVGNKIFFAGGSNYEPMDDDDRGNETSRVDIYDAVNNTWSIAELSKPRTRLAAATIGSKVFFAGGKMGGYSGEVYNIVDIYDNTTNIWTTATLSEGRFDLSATTAGNKIYFAGGFKNNSSAAKTIDIFDLTTNTWSISQLLEPRGSHASIATGNKIFWAGGAAFPYPSWSVTQLSGQVEIKDISTGVSSLTCIIPKSFFSAAVKNDNIIFFTGHFNNGWYAGYHFDIYNTISGQWSTGELSMINEATIICVNNTIYVAGGGNSVLGPYLTEVWKLEF